MQSVAQGGIAEADASHWVGPGVSTHDGESVVEVGRSVVMTGGSVVVITGGSVDVGAAVLVGDGYSDAQEHTALAASRTGRALAMPHAPRTQFIAAPLILAYVSGSH